MLSKVVEKSDKMFWNLSVWRQMPITATSTFWSSNERMVSVGSQPSFILKKKIETEGVGEYKIATESSQRDAFNAAS